MDDVLWDRESTKGPVLERLEELSGSQYVFSDRLGTPGSMSGVSSVALRFLVIVDAEIDERFRPALFDVLPAVADATEGNEEVRAKVATEFVCRELLAAVLMPTAVFSAEEITTLETTPSLADLGTILDGMLHRIDSKLADTENETEHDVKRGQLIFTARVLMGAAVAAEQVHAPHRCMTGVSDAVLQAAQIMEAEKFADITCRALHRISTA